MECLFFGVIGGMLYRVGVYTYKRFTSNPVDTNKIVIDTVLNAIEKNKCVRDAIRDVR